MERIYIKEGRREVLVVFEKHYPDDFTLLDAAQKALAREALRERINPNRNVGWQSDDHQLPTS